MTPEIVVAEEHGQIYELWKRRGERGLRLSHIDFHCDMRGLLIDRRRGRARILDAGDPRVARVDSGNFLGHAIMEGIVSAVRWVHDERGGRRHDVGTVKYESDLSALPHRLLGRLRRTREAPVEFEELLLRDWDGPRDGELLDIDWDGIASVDYEPERIARLRDEFLGRSFAARPRSTYLVYSPGYSHPDRELFESFLEALRVKLAAAVTRLPPPEKLAGREAPTWLGRLEDRLILALHRIGIY